MGDSNENKCRMVTGFGAWHIGDIRVSDGPHGVRFQDDGARNNDSIEATCFPTASALACSWDEQLAAEMAEGIADEAKELGVSVVLGPGVNIKRSPLCGRNFEYYSEDPYLAGKVASAFIRSMQENGVGTSLKHFAGNNQETHRMTCNSMIDDRALHEIYLAAFEMAVKEAGPATIMASYNHLNGKPACENHHLLTEILREQWGYEGLVMSDWGACVDLPACIAAGMDVEMPDSNGNHLGSLKQALKKQPELLDKALARIEKLQKDYPADDDRTGRFVSAGIREKNHELAERIEEGCAVLLKNTGFFPLPKGSRVLIVGDLAFRPRIQGGGSSHINTQKIESVRDAFHKHDAKLKCVRGYDSCSLKRNEKLEKSALEAVMKASKMNIPILFFGGLTDMAEGEGYDRESFKLPNNQIALLERILKITDNVGFISFGGAPYDMELPDKCRAVLQMYLGGESVMGACASLVMGDSNPSGKLAESIPFKAEDVPSFGNFGSQGEQSLHPDDVVYAESIFVGYRYYDTFNIPVRYCFGHGLSYTGFKYSDLSVAKNIEGGYDVSFYVENTGDIAGSEVSQLYVKNPENSDFRAKRELRGFAKSKLDPGEKKEVRIHLSDRAFSAWSDGEFRVIGGDYEIQIGSSLCDIRLCEGLDVDGEKLVSPLTLQCSLPLSDENFDRIYEYDRTDFSNLKPGEFTTKNSLVQLSRHSVLAKAWVLFGMLTAKRMYPGRPMSDPEVRMVLTTITEGSVDMFCNMSNGRVKRSAIEKIVDSANGK